MDYYEQSLKIYKKLFGEKVINIFFYIYFKLLIQ